MKTTIRGILLLAVAMMAFACKNSSHDTNESMQEGSDATTGAGTENYDSGAGSTSEMQPADTTTTGSTVPNNTGATTSSPQTGGTGTTTNTP